MTDQLEKLFGPNFKLPEIDTAATMNAMGLLGLNLLESNRLYRYLKSELELYYRERNRPSTQQTLHSHRSNSWKENLYMGLQALLNEVTYTLNPEIKAFLVSKVYNWYIEKSQRALEPPRHIIHTQPKQDSIYPLVLQGIESTESPKKPQIFPKVPKPMNNSFDDYRDRMLTSFPRTIRGTSTQSPARTARSRHFLRPFLKSQDNPVIVDLRTSSVCSPEGLKTTNFTDRESIERTARQSMIKDNLEGKVPSARRDQIKEVGNIKKRLASKHMSMPLRVLESGLVFVDFTQEFVPPERLPRGGELLLKESAKKETRKKKKRAKKSK